MNCKVHPSRNGVNTCSKCGEWLCDECSVEVNGRVICKGCIERLVNIPADSAGSGYRVEKGPKRHISWGILFMFSFCMPPGTNYMYMGLIKRGLFMISAFFLSIYFAVIMGIAPVLGFIIPVMYITCIFDGFNIRRRINAGEYVEDSARDVTGFLKRYKGIIIFMLALVVARNWLSAGWSYFNAAARYATSASAYSIGYIISGVINCAVQLIPTLIVLSGVYFILKSTGVIRRKKTVRKSDDEQ